MDADYPAAHSMDTTWFVVDRDGHVGVFESGEAGAVPQAVDRSVDGYDLLNEVYHSGRRSEFAYDASITRLPALPVKVRHLFERDWPWDDLLTFVAADTAIQWPLRRAITHAAPTADGLAIHWRRLSPQHFRRLHAAGLCRFCSLADLSSVWEDDTSPSRRIETASLGLFSYRHLLGFENWVAGGYGRVTLPLQPVRVEDLPEHVARIARRTRFETISFAETPFIQPLEHMPCSTWQALWTVSDGHTLERTWQSAWVASDGHTIRPVWDDDERYREFLTEAKQLPDHMAGFRLEPGRSAESLFPRPQGEPTSSTPEPDYPAAHSMDTDWFAVDRDGRVAVFSSGQTGAVPRAFQPGEVNGVYVALEEMRRVLPDTEVIYDPAFIEVPAGIGRDRHNDPQPYSNGLLMFLKDTVPVQKALASGRAIEVPAVEGAAVLWRELSNDEYKRLHRAGVCRCCAPRYDWYVFEENVLELASLGLYVYDHDICPMAGPYGRDSLPREPVYLDTLPPDVQEVAGRVTFPSFSFEETPVLQPIEHVGCRSWEGAWLARDLRTVAAVPGEEERYQAFIQRMASGFPGFLKHYQVQPPAAERGDGTRSFPAGRAAVGRRGCLSALLPPWL
jgi:hypothetical protein